MLEEFGFLREAAGSSSATTSSTPAAAIPPAWPATASRSARILAVADALDARPDRAYSRARPMEEAIREITRSGGRHFDPAVVDVFVTVPAGAWLAAGRGAAGLVRLPS